MLKLQTLVVAGVLALGTNSMAAAEQKESGADHTKPGKVVVQVVKLTGTVKAVDAQNKP